MLSPDTLARRAPAVRDGARRFWLGATKTQARAAAFGAYMVAALVMLLLVIAAVAPGPRQVSPPSADPLPSPTAENVPRTYRVAQGDTLAAVAERFGLDVDELRALNPDVDPMILAPGSRLRLRAAGPAQKAPPPPPPRVSAEKAANVRTPPPAPKPKPKLQATRVHVVSPGDTLFGIALAYGTTVDALIALNPRANPELLNSGQQIRIP